MHTNFSAVRASTYTDIISPSITLGIDTILYGLRGAKGIAILCMTNRHTSEKTLKKSATGPMLAKMQIGGN